MTPPPWSAAGVAGGRAAALGTILGTALVTAFVTVAALASCAGPPGSAATVSVSAGVRSTSTPDVPVVFADVGAVPTVSVGGAAEEGPAQLHRIQNVHVDARGRLWVADGGSGELRIFLPDGTPWKIRGGRGEGPGEFTRIRLLGAYAGDSVLVADDGNGRLSVFDPEGELVRSVSASTADGPWPRLFDAFADGSVLGQVPRILSAGALRPGQLLADSAELVRLDPSTGARTPVGGARGPQWIWTGSALIPVPFTVNAAFDVVGDAVHVAYGPAFRIRVLEGGRLVATYGVDRPARRVTDADAAAYRDFTETYIAEPARAQHLAALRHEARPSHLPAYREVTAAEDGRVWAERYQVDPVAAPVWDVYEADGRFAGRVDGPAGLAPSTITADALVGVWRDALGVERVRSYPFTKRKVVLDAVDARSGLRSWAVGTSALSALLGLAAILTVVRPLGPPPPAGRRRLVAVGVAGLGFQVAHAVEEYLTGFHDAFPRLLGLPPWDARAFLAFNAAWACVWAVSLVGLTRGWRIAPWPIWFLALAMVANGVAHPLLSLALGGWFPGLATAPVVAVAGLLLSREMLLATAPGHEATTGP
jgi:hypothetical protein